MASGAKLSVC